MNQHISDNKQEISKKIIEIISDKLAVDKNDIKEDSKFTDDLGADSLDNVELIMAFEESFNCEIPDEDASKIITVRDAIKYVESKLSN